MSGVMSEKSPRRGGVSSPTRPLRDRGEHHFMARFWFAQVRVLPASPELAGVVSRDFVSATVSLNLRSRFGLFVSALKIPFPGNGDFGSKRPGSNA